MLQSEAVTLSYYALVETVNYLRTTYCCFTERLFVTLFLFLTLRFHTRHDITVIDNYHRHGTANVFVLTWTKRRHGFYTRFTWLNADFSGFFMSSTCVTFLILTVIRNAVSLVPT